ncbi:MAG: enterochelin esterase [Butyrivibrio sp.]|nr:enterochelin esterase [Butyrivibrio sp.]
MNTALCFNDVIPYDGRPNPVVMRDGKYFLRLLEKDAGSVQMLFAEQLYDFKETEDGIWELELPFTTAFNCVQIRVDGRDTLSALLPISYGYSRPYNYVELPAKDGDFYALKDVPHGSVRREYFFSGVTGEWESCLVYTPAEYDVNPGKTYPVLYLQHGHGENEVGWTYSGKVNFIMDNLIAERKATPFVIVMNNGMVQKKTLDGEHIVDHLLFESMLLEDVIPFIESRYHAGGSKEKRGMAGLSMGSMQTSMTVMRHPEMFSEVGIFSGFLRDWISGSELDMSCHEPSSDDHLAVFDNAAAFNGYFRNFFRAMGDEDPFFDHFLSDDRLCSEKGIHFQRKVYKGTHDWNVWRMCINDFAQMIFKK